MAAVSFVTGVKPVPSVFTVQRFTAGPSASLPSSFRDDSKTIMTKAACTDLSESAVTTHWPPPVQPPPAPPAPLPPAPLPPGPLPELLVPEPLAATAPGASAGDLPQAIWPTMNDNSNPLGSLEGAQAGRPYRARRVTRTQ